MSNATHNNAPVYVLSENSFHALQEVRNQMFLMAAIIFASTREEEKIMLQLPRSMLGQCFQIFASQLADALADAQRGFQKDPGAPRTH